MPGNVTGEPAASKEYVLLPRAGAAECERRGEYKAGMFSALVGGHRIAIGVGAIGHHRFFSVNSPKPNNKSAGK